MALTCALADDFSHGLLLEPRFDLDMDPERWEALIVDCFKGPLVIGCRAMDIFTYIILNVGTIAWNYIIMEATRNSNNTNKQCTYD